MTKGGSKKMRAYVLIETAPGKTKAVKKELAAIQGTDSTVANLDAVTGPFDFIAVVEGPTLDAVGRLVTDEIGSIDGVTRTTTCLAVAIGYMQVLIIGGTELISLHLPGSFVTR